LWRPRLGFNLIVVQAYDKRLDDLLPTLAAGAREFVRWSQDRLIDVEQAESTPTEPLYHYTDEAALKGILTNQQLWCFSHLHQRDRTEFAYSLAIARDVIRDVGRSLDTFKFHLCGCLDDVLDNNSLTETFEFYMASLSRHRDDPQQWTEYGDHGRGFAIGFAPKLFQPDEPDLKEQANENLHVGRVIYGDEETGRRHRLVIETAAEIMSRYGHANPEPVRGLTRLHYLRAIVDEIIASQLVWNCLTAKSMQYANEREVRYVVLNLRGKFDAHRKVFREKYYIEAKLPLKEAGSLAEILVGPLAPDSAEQRLRQFLDEEGYGDIPVSRSAVRL
jgi:hypothetical protein